MIKVKGKRKKKSSIPPASSKFFSDKKYKPDSFFIQYTLNGDGDYDLVMNIKYGKSEKEFHGIMAEINNLADFLSPVNFIDVYHIIRENIQNRDFEEFLDQI